MFDINLIIVAILNLPRKYRTVNVIAYIKALLAPLIDVYIAFKQYRDAVNYKLLFNGQVIYLEHLLNDLFDPIDRDIQIYDTSMQLPGFWVFNKEEEMPPVFVHNKSENAPPLYIKNKSEVQQNLWDFWVLVPNTLTYDANLMKSWINHYKLAGKRYRIVTYDVYGAWTGGPIDM